MKKSLKLIISILIVAVIVISFFISINSKNIYRLNDKDIPISLEYSNKVDILIKEELDVNNLFILSSHNSNYLFKVEVYPVGLIDTMNYTEYSKIESINILDVEAPIYLANDHIDPLFIYEDKYEYYAVSKFYIENSTRLIKIKFAGNDSDDVLDNMKLILNSIELNY